MEYSKSCNTHNDELIMGICLATKCQFNSRLICFSCATSDHMEHSEFVVKIKDLGKDLIQHKKWPFDQLGKDMKKIIVESKFFGDDGLDIIEKLFDEQIQIIIAELERVKFEVKKLMEDEKQKKENKDNNTDVIQTVFEELFDLNLLQASVNSMINSEISELEFGSSITDFLKQIESPQIQQKMNSTLESERSQGGEQRLDVEILKSKFQDLSASIQKFPEQVFTYRCQSISFTPAPKNVGKLSEVEVIRRGIEYQLLTNYSAIITNTLNPNQRYQFEFQIVGSVNNCCMFGLLPESEQDNSQTAYSVHPFQCFATSCGAHHTGGNVVDTGISANGIMVVEIDFKQNIYSYGWKQSTARSTLTGYTIAEKKMVFYISAFNITGAQFKLVSSKNF